MRLCFPYISLWVAYLLAKQGSHSPMVSVYSSKRNVNRQKNLLKTINFLARIVAQRIEAIGSSINSQLKTRQTILSGFPWFLLFIWGVNAKFEVMKNYPLSIVCMEQVQEYFKEVEKTLSMTWSGVCQGVLQVMIVKIMYGAEKGLVGQLTKLVKQCLRPIFSVLDCGKYFNLSCVIEPQCQW